MDIVWSKMEVCELQRRFDGDSFQHFLNSAQEASG
jgi:hypothetical protein